MFVPGKFISLVLYLRVRLEPTPKLCPSQRKIGLWRVKLASNTLAYFTEVWMTKKQKFFNVDTCSEFYEQFTTVNYDRTKLGKLIW